MPYRLGLLLGFLSMVILGSFGATLVELRSQILTVTCESCKCPPSYVYNPFSNTCLRLVRERRNWLDAYNYCKLANEDLLVLETLESINWFNNLRRTNIDWNSGWLWIGGRRFNNLWYWLGRVKEQLLQQDWEDPVQPDFTPLMDCLQVFDQSRLYKWDNWNCEIAQNFVCERRSRD